MYSNPDNLTLKETILLSPIEKHIYHNKPPYRFILNLAILVLAILQISAIFDEEASLPREQIRIFNSAILDSSDDETLVLNLQKISDIQDNLQNTQDFFQNINDNLFQDVDASATIYQLQTYNRIIGQMVYDIDMSEGFVDPFNVSDAVSITRFFNSIIQMNFVITNMLTMTTANENLTSCYNWTLTITYDIQSLNQLEVSLEAMNEICYGDLNIDIQTSPNRSSILWTSLMITLLAIISIVVTLIHYDRVSRLFIETQALYVNYLNHNKNLGTGNMGKRLSALGLERNVGDLSAFFKYPTWDDVPILMKMKMMNGWRIFNTFGNFMQISSSLIVTIAFIWDARSQDIYLARLLLGLSGFFTWMQLFEYLEYWRGLTLITTTFQKNIADILVFLGLITVVIIGCSVISIPYSLFWKYDHFDSFGMAMRSIFALSCGDIVHSTFSDIDTEGLLKQVIVFIIVLLFYTAAQNLFYAVLMEGYDRAKIRNMIDGDDPFPTIENLKKANTITIEEEQHTTELIQEASAGTREIYELLDHPDVSSDEKNVINLLLFNLQQAKLKVLSLRNISKHFEHDKAKMDKFTADQLKFYLGQLAKKVEYYETLYA